MVKKGKPISKSSSSEEKKPKKKIVTVHSGRGKAPIESSSEEEKPVSNKRGKVGSKSVPFTANTTIKKNLPSQEKSKNTLPPEKREPDIKKSTIPKKEKSFIGRSTTRPEGKRNTKLKEESSTSDNEEEMDIITPRGRIPQKKRTNLNEKKMNITQPRGRMPPKKKSTLSDSEETYVTKQMRKKESSSSDSEEKPSFRKSGKYLRKESTSSDTEEVLSSSDTEEVLSSSESEEDSLKIEESSTSESEEEFKTKQNLDREEEEEVITSTLPSRKELLPKDIMTKVAEFMSTKDRNNTLATNSTMNLMKFTLPLNLSDKPMLVAYLFDNVKKLSKYKITSLNIIIKNKPFKEAENSKTIALVKSLLQKISHLTLEIKEDNGYDHISMILSKCKNLTSLHYEDDSFRSYKRAIKIPPKNFLHLKKLTKLVVKSVPLLDLKGLTKLKYLEIEESDEITNLETCSSLQTLILKECKLKGNLELKSLTQLTDINISRTQLKGEIKGLNNKNLEKAYFDRIKGITSLNLNNCSSLHQLYLYLNISTGNTFTLESLEGCTKLEQLEVIGNISITSLSKSLKRLSVENCFNFNLDAVLISSQLEELSLEIYGDSPKDLSWISNCINLRTFYFNFGNCKSIKGIHTLNKLENLDLSSLYYLKDITPLSTCISLKRLKLPSKIKSTLPLASCVNLISLNLKTAPDLDGLENCVNLVDLTILDCHVRNLSVLSKCTQLKSLKCEEFYNLTSLTGLEQCTSLIKIKLKKFPKLKNITALQNCSSLSKIKLIECDELKDISFLERCTSLINFYEISCYNINIKDLAKCKNLIKIKLSWEREENYSLFEGLPFLISLNIGRNKNNWLYDRNAINKVEEGNSESDSD
jgi:hypothetical protein